MKRTLPFIISLVIGLLAVITAQAQSFVLQGKVLDEQTSDPLPFVNIGIKGQSTGTFSDSNGITQVLHNLLDNAVKFTAQGGRIGLTACAAAGEETAQLVVWDTGIGIAPADQARIFQPFVQGDSSLARSYEGIGLGLAYAIRMVELLGGTLTVDSTRGQGSRFTVTLPVQPAPVGRRR